MCGIAGIVQSSPIYAKEHLKKMTDALLHRGPDGEGSWQNSDSSCLLGHRRLSIIDLNVASAQPMHLAYSQSKGQALDRYSIIHNGEIYNYIELRKELEAEGYSFRTQSDTEVILASYDHWEDNCLDHFDGMFAFAIWDELEKELFAARDRFGEKPFYYYHQDNTLCFASEMKGLWAAGIPRTANLKMLFNFITIGYVDNPTNPEETFFEKIFQLPPASYFYYSPESGDLLIEKYWEIDPDFTDKKISDEDAIAKFSELLKLSVARRLRSDVKMGSSLSGGLDSSSINALIFELNGSSSSQSCFTATFPGFEKDELAFSKQVAEQFHLQQYIISVTGNDLVNDWDKFSRHQEEPVSSASAFAQYKVFELAKQNKVKVLLDGQGADETLAGYHKYYKWYWQELFQKRKLMRSGEIKAARALGVKEQFNYKNIIAALVPDLASVILERQYLVNALTQEDLSRDFVKLQSQEAYYATPELRNLNGVLHFNTHTHGLSELLRYADRNSMAHGTEIRLPFLSHELVSFLSSLPANFKIRKGWTKWLLRTAIGKRIPESIRWRKDKIGFEPPQKLWMENVEMQQMIKAGKEKLVKENILKPASLNKAIQPNTAYEANNYDWRYFAASQYL